MTQTSEFEAREGQEAFFSTPYLAPISLLTDGVPGFTSPRIKRLEREGDHLYVLLARADFKTAWRYMCQLPLAIMRCAEFI
jgi:hypothetical protein